MSKPNREARVVQAWFTPEEHDEIKAAIERDGRTIAGVIRMLLRNYVAELKAAE